MPEFEIPTDDLPKEEQSEVCPERLTAYNLEQIINELDADTRTKDAGFLQSLTRDLNKRNKNGEIGYDFAHRSASAIYSLGINLPALTPERIDLKLNHPESLKQLVRFISDSFEWCKTDSAYASFVCEILFAVRSLGIKHPELSPEKLDPKLNDPAFLQKLTEYIINALQKGKADSVLASYACQSLFAALSLGIKHPELTLEKVGIKLNDPDFLKQLTEYIDHALEEGKASSYYAPHACWTISAIQNLIIYYSALADEKEKAQAAHKLKIAADRTGVPPRPEIKSF